MPSSAVYLTPFTRHGQVLGGVWYEGAPCLKGTDYARLGYHVHNFNDLPTALVTCWVLTNINK